MSSRRISYATRPDTTPESELSALAAVYKFVLDCHSTKKGTRPGAPDDAKVRSEDDSRATRQYT